MREQEAGTGAPADRDGRIERTYEITIRPGATAVGAFEAEVNVDFEEPVAFQLVVPVVGEVIAAE